MEEEIDILIKNFGEINIIDLDELYNLIPRGRKVLSFYEDLLEKSYELGYSHLLLSKRSGLKSKNHKNIYSILNDNISDKKKLYQAIYLTDREIYNLLINIKSKLLIPHDYYGEIILSKDILVYLSFNLNIKIYDKIKILTPFITVSKETNLYKILNISDKTINYIKSRESKRVTWNMIRSNIDETKSNTLNLIMRLYSIRLVL